MDYRWTTAEMCVKTHAPHTWKTKKTHGVSYSKAEPSF